MGIFGAVQRGAGRFSRPELWVFPALLGAQTTIAVVIAIVGAGLTPALAMMCWPVAGLAGRFPNRASRLGTIYSVVVAVATIIVIDPSILRENPLAPSLLVVALVSVFVVMTVLRDSDIENRGAALVDPLTGMLNRSALNHRVTEIEHQSLITGEPVAVLVADLDRFKRVNDNHGHARGDVVLQEVAHRLRSQLRAYDLAYRIGGEEFVVLLLGASPATATATAEQLRAAIAAEPIAGLDVTISIGVAASAWGGPFNWSEIFERADAALYRAKGEGRDRVAVDAAMEASAELTAVPAG
jgi:diguanylate cyclase (GGDEF)-like protein